MRKLLVLTILLASCSRDTKPPTPAPDEPVNTLEMVFLGGVDQTIQLRGAADAPLLLFLHGGPGNSEMKRAHHYAKYLESQFIVVHWDQRGAGRSFSETLKPEMLSLDRITDDAIELTEKLKERFPGRPVLLVGHSWGSIVGITSVARRPDLFCAYVGMGQFVDTEANMRVAFEHVQKWASTNETARTELEALGEPPFERDGFFRFASLIVQSGAAIHGQQDLSLMQEIEKKSPMPLLPHELDGSDQLFSVAALWDDMIGVDFPKTVPKLELPVYFFLGRHDFNTPSSIAAAYLESLGAPLKKVIWFESSAHMPNLEEPQAFGEALLEVRNQSCVMGTRHNQ